jgi:putative transposase
VYRFIHAEKAEFPVAFSCRVLGVARSGYYRWLSATPSTRSVQDRMLTAKVRDIHHEHKSRYGSPRIHRELRARGERVGRKRVARLMRADGLQGRRPRRFKKTTDSRRTKRIAPNLLNRDFTTTAPNRAWVGDVTYIPTRQGWLYLAVLVDLFSRRVVGWATSDRIDTNLVLAALNMAVENRQPPAGLIHHTDRDVRYASDDYIAALKRHGMVASMSRKADCWDNAVAESFFATLEKELLDGLGIVTHRHGHLAVADYIDNYYNDRRRHSYIDYETPLEYELTSATV